MSSPSSREQLQRSTGFARLAVGPYPRWSLVGCVGCRKLESRSARSTLSSKNEKIHRADACRTAGAPNWADPLRVSVLVPWSWRCTPVAESACRDRLTPSRQRQLLCVPRVWLGGLCCGLPVVGPCWCSLVPGVGPCAWGIQDPSICLNPGPP